MNGLFRRVVVASGISSLFADHAIARACERAGVDPNTLTPATLKLALPEIERTVDTFCHDQRDAIIARLHAIVRG